MPALILPTASRPVNSAVTPPALAGLPRCGLGFPLFKPLTNLRKALRCAVESLTYGESTPRDSRFSPDGRGVGLLLARFNLLFIVHSYHFPAAVAIKLIAQPIAQSIFSL